MIVFAINGTPAKVKFRIIDTKTPKAKPIGICLFQLLYRNFCFLLQSLKIDLIFLSYYYIIRFNFSSIVLFVVITSPVLLSVIVTKI